MQGRAQKHRDSPADSTDCTSWPRLLCMHIESVLLTHWADKTAIPLTASLNLPSSPPLCQVGLSLRLLSKQVDPSNSVKLYPGCQLSACVPDLPDMCFFASQGVFPVRQSVDSGERLQHDNSFDQSPSSTGPFLTPPADLTAGPSRMSHMISNVPSTEKYSACRGSQVQHVPKGLAEFPAKHLHAPPARHAPLCAAASALSDCHTRG